jgi:hypothetical protein
MNFTIPEVERRLQDRYQRLVQEHAGQAHPTASGPRLLPDQASAKAGAMAAWRFYANPRIRPTRLAQPLLVAAADLARQHCRDFALVPLDWSWLDYSRHASKADRAVGPQGLRGYKLLSALLISDQDGLPLAPLCAQLQTARGLLSSRFDRCRRPGTALDELAPVLAFVNDLPLGKRPVYIIDQEADSVFHWRWWQRRGALFLVRGDDDRSVRLGGPDGPELRLPAIAQRLRQQGAFARAREVDYHGRPVGQYVAEVAVVVDRRAWLHREVGGARKRLVRPGVALPLRLVVTELRDRRGRVLERWYLFTNVPAEVSAATITLWYYWRWKAETFFKLLKGAGQQIEHWQQEDGRAILKRLLVASMACVLAWRLGHSAAPQADAARRVVMSLSGRQLEHGKEFTLEGLVAGTWVLLALAALLKQRPAAEVQQLADFVLSGSVQTSTQPTATPDTG